MSMINDYTYLDERETALDQAKNISRAVGHGVKRAAPYAVLAAGGLAVAGIGVLLFAPPAKKARKSIGKTAKGAFQQGKQLAGEAMNKVDEFQASYPETYRLIRDIVPGGK